MVSKNARLPFQQSVDDAMEPNQDVAIDAVFNSQGSIGRADDRLEVELAEERLERNMGTVQQVLETW